MQLSQSQESENSNCSGVKLVDTSDSDHEGELGISWDVNLTGEFGISSGISLGFLGGGVVSVVLLGSLGDLLSLDFVRSFSLFSLFLEGLSDLAVSLLFFDETLGLGGDFHLSWHCFFLPQNMFDYNL